MARARARGSARQIHMACSMDYEYYLYDAYERNTYTNGLQPRPTKTGEPSAQGGTLPLGSSSESPEARALTFSGLAAVGSEEVVGGKNVKREGCHRTAFDSR